MTNTNTITEVDFISSNLEQLKNNYNDDDKKLSSFILFYFQIFDEMEKNNLIKELQNNLLPSFKLLFNLWKDTKYENESIKKNRTNQEWIQLLTISSIKNSDQLLLKESEKIEWHDAFQILEKMNEETCFNILIGLIKNGSNRWEDFLKLTDKWNNENNKYMLLLNMIENGYDGLNLQSSLESECETLEKTDKRNNL